PLHEMKPDYPVPYGAPGKAEIKKVLDKVFTYLDAVTPAQMINKTTNEEITDVTKADTNIAIKQGDFRLTAYEWGVTHAGMMLAGETTGDKNYTNYAQSRFALLSKWIPVVKKLVTASGPFNNNNYPLRQPIDPKALDDAGAV